MSPPTGATTLANILSAGPQHPHGTYATSPHPRHLVPSAYASCLICLICPFATGPFSIFFAAGPTAIFYTAWLSGCMACARARSPPPSRHTPFCIPVGRQAPPVPPASHFFCLRCIYLLSVICLPFLLCVCPLTGLCRKSITCNCRASARLASHAPPTPPVSDRPLVSPRAVDKPRHLTEPNPTLWSVLCALRHRGSVFPAPPNPTFRPPTPNTPRTPLFGWPRPTCDPLGWCPMSARGPRCRFWHRFARARLVPLIPWPARPPTNRDPNSSLLRSPMWGPTVCSLCDTMTCPYRPPP
jgi:hypothetical protein